MFKCVNGIDKIDRDDFIEMDPGRRTRGGHELKLSLLGSTTDKEVQFPSKSRAAMKQMAYIYIRSASLTTIKLT